MTQLAHSRFQQAEFVRNEWRVTPEYGTPADALLSPAYWAHVSAKLRRGDIVVAFAEDSSYYMELLVLDAGRLYAKMAELRRIDIKPAQMVNVPVPEGYEIKFRGPKKWSVLRGKDVLKEGLEKPAAEQWLVDHLKVA